MSEFVNLTTRRGQLKGSLTRFYNYVKTENPDPIQIKVRKEKIEDIWNEYQQAQSEIDVEADVKAEEQVQYRLEFEEIYYKSVALAIRIIEVMDKNIKSQEVRANSEQGINLKEENVFDNLSKDLRCRLPPLNVPIFSGDYHEWSEFSEMFTSLVHKRTDLSAVEKFLYLRSSLKDDALRSIQCLETTSSNYEEARELLFKRYSNTKIRTQSHVKAIFDLEPISTDSAHKLRQFTDTLTGHMRALGTLGYQPNLWGPILVHLICTKLDKTTLKEWETKSSKEEVAAVSELLIFLEDRYKILEAVESSKSINTRSAPKLGHSPAKGFSTRSSVLTSMAGLKCNFCGSSHTIYHCMSFLALSVSERIKRVKELKLCVNCLRSHPQKRCLSRNCFKCSKPHNTLLHLQARRSSVEKVACDENKNETTIVKETVPDNATFSMTNHVATYQNKTVLLPTAVALIKNKAGELIRCRVLLDSGSQSNFLTERMVQLLKLPKQNIRHKVFGIGGVAKNISASVTATVTSRFDEFSLTLSCLVVKRISNNIPLSFGIKLCCVPSNIQLADPLFMEPQRIDMLIGAEHFYDLLGNGNVKIEANGPTFQKTHFGWIVSGQIVDNSFLNVNSSTFIACSSVPETDSTLELLISRFWRLEEYGPKNTYTIEEKACKNNFDKTVQRGDDGRFIVHLPFRDNASDLGNSYTIAMKRFLSLEKRLQNDEHLRIEYCKFMFEYEKLGHMERVEENELNNSVGKICYLPHHAVINEQKTSTKVRVVFDASCKTETGVSLNDVLLKGPVVQDDLIYILSRFRTHNFVLVGDIVKMYRQMWVLKKHCDVQRILWRPNPTLPIQTFRLKTITYGTVPASFLATACLQKLSELELNRYPRACNAIMNCFYVDDLFCGAETREGLIELRDELLAVMNGAGLQLSKWASNDRKNVADLSTNENDKNGHTFDTTVTKVLGLCWDSAADSFRYTVHDIDLDKQVAITKGSILSDVSKLFDPIGMRSSIIINAKLIMQNLWQVKVGWDEPVPRDIEAEWRNYAENLSLINNIVIPRKLFPGNKVISYQIHGFADSSIRAYGAVIYIRSTDENGTHFVRIICAKSKVAPIKTVSLPRLELCAALLLARLSSKIVPKLKLVPSKTFYWADSSIVLAWISSPSAKWKTFVAHRIGEIQELTAVSDWFHVRTHENPADVISRGCTADELLSSSSLYWSGPDWLRSDPEWWPTSQEQTKYDNLSQLPEAKIQETHSNLCTTSEEFNSFVRCSSYKTVVRAVA